MTHLPLSCAAAALLALAGCATVAPPAPVVALAPRPDAVVKEAWISSDVPAKDVGSLAAWPTEAGSAWLIATAGSSDQLMVFDADSGQRLRTVGGPGDGPGRFRQPEGIAVWGDLVFVVERGNHRVQVLALPDFSPRGLIGADSLTLPSGIWLHETAPNQLELLVPDSAVADVRGDGSSTGARKDQRVRRFTVQLDEEGPITGTGAGSFADPGGADGPRRVESIAGDPAHDRLLITDADPRGGSVLRDYTLEGHFRGGHPLHFSADAEGLALWDCDVDGGWWIAVDRRSPTLFRLHDRASLAPVGTFAGEVVSQTGGVALYAAGTPRFPEGALFVLHDARAVAAFDLRDIGRALHLRGSCLQ